MKLQDSDSYEFPFYLKEPKKFFVFCQYMPEEFEMKFLGPQDIELEASVDRHFHAGHSHDDLVSSLSIELPELLDMNRLILGLKVFVKALPYERNSCG